MKHINPTKTAGSNKQSGNNQNNNPIEALATAWIAYSDQTADQSRKERLAEALDRTLMALLPNGRLRDNTRGREGEIRNESALTCLDAFFEGNQDLRRATLELDSEEIISQLRRSINAALRIHSARLRKEAAYEATRFVNIEDEQMIPSESVHPSLRSSERDLPPALRADVVLNAVNQALDDRDLPAKTARLISEMAEMGMTAAEVGRRNKISRNAVRQRLRRAAKSITAILESTELTGL